MILVCGEALIDLFVGPVSPDVSPDISPDAPAALPARAIAGGSPFNVAVGLARLGAPAAYLGVLGTDAFGAFLLDRLRRESVDTALVKRSDAPTPLVVVGPGPDGSPCYTFHATACADRDLHPADLPPALPPGITGLALGSYAIAVEPVGSTLLALAEREAGRLVISLDPNLRPALVGDLGAWRERVARFARVAGIIKLSAEDFHLGWGADADPERQAAAWLAQGVELVVLTRGDAGAVAYRRGGRIVVPGRRVAVIDTVGAGDTFHAALLAGLSGLGRLRPGAIAGMAEPELAAVLHRAVLASSLTCTRSGADLPTLAELDAAG